MYTVSDKYVARRWHKSNSTQHLFQVVRNDEEAAAAGFQCPVMIASRVWDGLAYFVLQPNFTESGQYTAKIVSQG